MSNETTSQESTVFDEKNKVAWLERVRYSSELVREIYKQLDGAQNPKCNDAKKAITCLIDCIRHLDRAFTNGWTAIYDQAQIDHMTDEVLWQLATSMIEAHGGHHEWSDSGGNYYLFLAPKLDLGLLAARIRDACKGILANQIGKNIIRLKSEVIP